MESDGRQYITDTIRFKDFITTWNIKSCPPQYLNFMIMEILNLSKPEIQAMDFIEWNEAVNYATVRVQMLNMTTTKGNDGKNKIHYNQPPGFDHDPNFVSQVN